MILYVLEGNKILSEKIYNTSNNTLLVELNYNYDIKGELVSAEYN